ARRNPAAPATADAPAAAPDLSKLRRVNFTANPPLPACLSQRVSTNLNLLIKCNEAAVKCVHLCAQLDISVGLAPFPGTRQVLTCREAGRKAMIVDHRIYTLRP